MTERKRRLAPVRFLPVKTPARAALVELWELFAWSCAVRGLDPSATSLGVLLEHEHRQGAQVLALESDAAEREALYVAAKR